MSRATIALGLVLALGGCGAPAHEQPTTKVAPTVDPEILSLRAQLAQARSERDAALARLRALQGKPAVVRVVVRQPANPATAQPSDSGQSATQVFSSVSTSP